MMLAVLPRQTTDDLGGELFVAAYERQLGHYPADAINFLVDEATRRCKWFPTISECLELLAHWRRHDDATIRRLDARAAVNRERRLRDQDGWVKPEPMEWTPEVIEQMPASLRRMGLRAGWLVQNPDGTIEPAQ